METKRVVGYGIIVELVAIAWMIVEFSVGFKAGIDAHSVVLIVFGLDSLMEIVAGIVLLVRLGVEFDGSKMDINLLDRISTKIVSIILLLLCGYILITSGYNLFQHEGADSSLMGMVISIMSLIIMPFIAYAKYWIGKVIGSDALIQDAMCSVTCAYLAGTVLVGVLINYFFHIWWIDSVAAILIVFIIGKEALECFVDD